MAEQLVKLSIPFEVLEDSVVGLGLEEKRRLLETLEKQVAQAEEEMWEQDSQMQAEILDAREAYQRGDYLTIDEYMERSKKGD